MKKLLCILLFAALFLAGCEKKLQDTAPAAVFQVTDGIASSGVAVGDGKAEFIAAYSDYIIQAAFTDLDSSYVQMDIDRIPYSENISTLIANFFIDETPVSEAEICEENDIRISGLHALLSSYEYLRAHTVVYRYLRFTWENGAITEIDCNELNYNETYGVPCLE